MDGTIDAMDMMEILDADGDDAGRATSSRAGAPPARRRQRGSSRRAAAPAAFSIFSHQDEDFPGGAAATPDSMGGHMGDRRLRPVRQKISPAGQGLRQLASESLSTFLFVFLSRAARRSSASIFLSGVMVFTSFLLVQLMISAFVTLSAEVLWVTTFAHWMVKRYHKHPEGRDHGNRLIHNENAASTHSATAWYWALMIVAAAFGASLLGVLAADHFVDDLFGPGQQLLKIRRGETAMLAAETAAVAPSVVSEPGDGTKLGLVILFSVLELLIAKNMAFFSGEKSPMFNRWLVCRGAVHALGIWLMTPRFSYHMFTQWLAMATIDEEFGDAWIYALGIFISAAAVSFFTYVESRFVFHFV